MAPVGHFHFRSITKNQKNELSTIGLEYDPASKLYRGVPNAAHMKDNQPRGPQWTYCAGGIKLRRLSGIHICPQSDEDLFIPITDNPLQGCLVRSDSVPTGAQCSRTNAIEVDCLNKVPGQVAAIPALMTDTIILSLRSRDIAISPLSSSQKIEDISIDPSTTFSVRQDGLVFPFFKGMVLPDREFWSCPLEIASAGLYGHLEDVNSDAVKCTP